MHVDKVCIRLLAGAAEVEVGAAEIRGGGLANDQDWLLVSAGRSLRRRDHPRLAQVGQEIREISVRRGGELVLHLPKGGSIIVPLAEEGDLREVKLDGRLTLLLDQGDEAAARFSEYFAADVRLMRRPVPEPEILEQFPGLRACGQVKVISAKALRRLNTALRQAGEEPVTEDFFQANLVLAEAEIELLDRCRELAGDMILLQDGQMCPWEGDPDSPVGQALAYRRSRGKMYFGSVFQLSPGTDGMTVGVGDRFRPSDIGPAPQFDPAP